MLELKNIVFEVPVEEGSSKTKRIIDDISLTVEENRFVVVTGPNGGGKSTLAKIIMGIETPTSGQILFNGQDITHASITDRANLGIGYGFQQPARFKGMKVKKLLELAAGKRLPMLSCNEYLRIIELADEIICLRDGTIEAQGPAEKIIPLLGLVHKENTYCSFTDPTELHITEIPTTC